MPADENTRLRIRQYLIELMDEPTADAMMEAMPPIPWTQLARKDDLAPIGARLDTLTLRVEQNSSDIQALSRAMAAQGTASGERIDGLGERVDSLGERLDTRIGDLAERLDARIDGVSDRIDDLAERLDARIDGVSDRIDGVSDRIDSMGVRMDSIGVRMDDLGMRMDGLARAVTAGAVTIGVTLAVFIVGTIASLIASGAIA